MRSEHFEDTAALRLMGNTRVEVDRATVHDSSLAFHLTGAYINMQVGPPMPMPGTTTDKTCLPMTSTPFFATTAT